MPHKNMYGVFQLHFVLFSSLDLQPLTVWLIVRECLSCFTCRIQCIKRDSITISVRTDESNQNDGIKIRIRPATGSPVLNQARIES